jgi:hypothetical protein
MGGLMSQAWYAGDYPTVYRTGVGMAHATVVSMYKISESNKNIAFEIKGWKHIPSRTRQDTCEGEK